MKKITKKDLIGDIEGFPIEVVEKMIERQVEQRNPADVVAFQIRKRCSSFDGGFRWEDTREGHTFWDNVIDEKDFDVFFEKYPKFTYPRVMEVSDEPDFPTGRSFKRVVFMEKNGRYLAWDRAETLEEAEEKTNPSVWGYARDIEEPIELTIDEIAKKFGVNANQIKIKK